MHELAVTRSIVDIVVRNAAAQEAKRVLQVHLIVGKVRNFEQVWVQRYFDRFSKGTIAEGARIAIDYVPIAFYCHACGETFTFELGHDQEVCCPACGSTDYEMVTGGELMIKEIEVA
ncbi:MAG: hydrogenase maturation nickel metallochaperone HypA [Eggerthellaceae bacterium]|jgi:hydrogenase nickel incorporation protein HypA/HybF